MTQLITRRETKDPLSHLKFDCQPGDWWEAGDHLLYVGDSTNIEYRQTCWTFGPAFAFADPPYGVGADAWDSELIWDHDYLAAVANYVIVTPGTTHLDKFMRKTEMPYRWLFGCHLTNGMTRSKVGFANWIPALLFSHDKVYKGCKDFLSIPIRPSHSDGRPHKGRKPREFVGWLMNLYTKTGDWVADPFLGSGTTLVVAEELGRRCIGAELHPGYASSCLARWASFTGRTPCLVVAREGVRMND